MVPRRVALLSMYCRGVDIRSGGLKTTHVKFLHYHAYFCVTTSTYYSVYQKIWGGAKLAPLRYITATVRQVGNN